MQIDAPQRKYSQWDCRVNQTAKKVNSLLALREIFYYKLWQDWNTVMDEKILNMHQKKKASKESHAWGTLG